jgi:hypothetical protein
MLGRRSTGSDIPRAPKQEENSTRFGDLPRAESQGIPFQLDVNHIFVQGMVNGSGPLWISLDTGASGSLIAINRALSLGLNFQGQMHTQGAGGVVESALVTGVSLKLPGVYLSNLAMAAVSLDGLDARSGRHIDVILGSEFFNRYVVEIDYAARLIRTYEPRSYQYRGAGEVVPLTFHENHPYIRASLEASGEKPFMDEFVIDMGSGFSVLLPRGFIDKHRELQAIQEAVKTEVTSIGGPVPVSVGRLTRLRIGRLSVQSPVTVFARTSRGIFAVDGKAGNLGNEILRRFKVTFDYSRRQMILEPTSALDEPDEFDMSGLSLLAEGPNLRVYRVGGVIADSPAAEAGIQVGDSIIDLNGTPIADLGMGKLRQLFKRPGSSYTLKIQRGGQPLTVKLKLRRLV